MPRASRKRFVAAPPSDVWSIVSDPYHLPRWWPRVTRVENVRAVKGGRRSQWTTVMETAQGKPVRADYRCVSAAEGERYVWEQEVDDTPFERMLDSSRTEIRLDQEDGGTRVRITTEQRLRGLSRLGGPMMRRATRRVIDAALRELETIVAPGAS